MTDSWAHGLTSTVEQVSLTCHHHLVMYDLGIAICSLAQSEGGRPIEWMTTEKTKQGSMVPQLRP